MAIKPYSFSPKLYEKLENTKPDSSLNKIKKHIDRCNKLYENSLADKDTSAATSFRFKDATFNKDGDMLLQTSVMNLNPREGNKVQLKEFKIPKTAKNIIMSFAEQINSFKKEIEKTY